MTASQVHFYRREDGGSLVHWIDDTDDGYGGTVQPSGDVVRLLGWPTPGMRRAIGSDGYATPFYVGTDESGNVLEVRDDS